VVSAPGERPGGAGPAYQRFRPDVMLSTVVVLVVIVQAVQFVGDSLAKRFDRR